MQMSHQTKFQPGAHNAVSGRQPRGRGSVWDMMNTIQARKVRARNHTKRMRSRGESLSRRSEKKPRARRNDTAKLEGIGHSYGGWRWKMVAEVRVSKRRC
ncbi:MAG: uncharacterized protein A8A55_3629 [Amphiamblys sp. WSBS2006]|nr:MAG: uncharacterized protein A8A55_3629 [Amphiamblys sp. WSBS2006]